MEEAFSIAVSKQGNGFLGFRDIHKQCLLTPDLYTELDPGMYPDMFKQEGCANWLLRK